MSNAAEHTDVKRALIEKYLREKRPQRTDDTNARPEGTHKIAYADARAHVTPIQKNGSKRPFFFLHGHWLGTAYYCYSLAADLGSDQPFYALEPYSFDGLLIPPRIEDIAAAHIKTMQSIQPEGPYLLGGFCNGALIAYEMARQLDSQGQKVDMLVLLDPMALCHTLPRYQRLLRRLTNRLRDPHKQLDWFVRLRHMLRTSRNYLYALLPWGNRGNVEAASWEVKPSGSGNEASPLRPSIASIIPSHETIHQDYVAIVEWLVLDYRPSDLYRGKITFFWPEEALEHVAWWNTVAKAAKIEKYFIPGTQTTWKTRYIHELSRCLSTCFSKMVAT
jgi:hypothetical protein